MTYSPGLKDNERAMAFYTRKMKAEMERNRAEGKLPLPDAQAQAVEDEKEIRETTEKV